MSSQTEWKCVVAPLACLASDGCEKNSEKVVGLQPEAQSLITGITDKDKSITFWGEPNPADFEKIDNLEKKLAKKVKMANEAEAEVAILEKQLESLHGIIIQEFYDEHAAEFLEAYDAYTDALYVLGEVSSDDSSGGTVF